MRCAFAVGAMALSACGATEHSSPGANGGAGGAAGNVSSGGALVASSGGARPSGGASASGGLAGTSGGTGPGSQACAPPAGASALFCGQQVQSFAPATRELYSWTTAEQAAELRRDRELFTRSERPGMGPGYAFTYMMQMSSLQGAIGTLLKGVLGTFEKGRYAWPHPWATRMGWPDEDYGDQLLRIVLKPEAWVLVVIERGGINVVDMKGNVVPNSDAAAAIDRIGAVYFMKTDVTGNGSFAQCSGGYREFIVGNLAMIEEWSLGTQAIRARIESDAALIEAFRLELEPSPPVFDAANFNRQVACSWEEPVRTNLDRYERSLAIPSANYLPTQSALGTLRDTLRASLFDPAPLVVKPAP